MTPKRPCCSTVLILSIWIMILVNNVYGSSIKNQQQPRLRGRYNANIENNDNNNNDNNEQQQQYTKQHKNKQAEVIHHRLSSNSYELIYYYNQDIVTNPISLHEQGGLSSSSVTADSGIYYDQASNNIGLSESNVYKVSIYKEPKCHTSVGTAIYTCNNHHHHHHQQQYIPNDISNNNNEAICTIQIIFYSSNTATNQTTNTLHMQGIVTTPSTSVEQRNRRQTETTSDITSTNTNSDTFSIIGGTGIYFGASGQSIITTANNQKEYSVYKTIATFSILPIQQQQSQITTAIRKSSSLQHQQQDITNNNPNATLPIIPSINTNTNSINNNNNHSDDDDMIHHSTTTSEQKQRRIRWTQLQT